MGGTCDTKGEMGNAYKNLMVKPELKKPQGAVELEDIINIDVKEGCKSVVASSDKLERSTQGGKFIVQLSD
jgi:hypothetical protein